MRAHLLLAGALLSPLRASDRAYRSFHRQSTYTSRTAAARRTFPLFRMRHRRGM